jgi:NAD(P)H-flavin reductase
MAASSTRTRHIPIRGDGWDQKGPRGSFHARNKRMHPAILGLGRLGLAPAARPLRTPQQRQPAKKKSWLLEGG